jgi:hypothetical protein
MTVLLRCASESRTPEREAGCLWAIVSNKETSPSNCFMRAGEELERLFLARSHSTALLAWRSTDEGTSKREKEEVRLSAPVGFGCVGFTKERKDLTRFAAQNWVYATLPLI